MSYITFMEEKLESKEAHRPARIGPEYILIGALLLIGAVAVPAVADVYLIQSFVLSICTGLGFQ